MKNGLPGLWEQRWMPCRFSKQCVRLVDDIDAAQWDEEGIYSEEGQAIEQLRLHATICDSCAATLTRTRKMRLQQRILLRDYLVYSEQQLPSTSQQILRTIQRHAEVVDRIPEEPHSEAYNPRRTSSRLTSFSLTVFSLIAMITIVVASIGVFEWLVFPRNTEHRTATVARSVGSWNSIVMMNRQGKEGLISNYDLPTGRRMLLATSAYPGSTMLDGASSEGKQILYHVFDGTRTNYYLLPGGRPTPIFSLAGRGQRALWSSDDRSIFVSTPTGVVRIGIADGRSVQILSLRQQLDLRFYRNGYLYYYKGTTRAAGLLERVSLAQRNMQVVTRCAEGDNFWLSPDGSTVNYHCLGRPDLFSVDSDGSNARVLRHDVGMMIGYGTNNQPLTLKQTGGKFQVISLGADGQHDRVLQNDLAPGAIQISAEAITVAPIGDALILKAYYTIFSGDIWYINLRTNDRRLLVKLQPALLPQPQVDGWNCLSPGAATAI